MNLTELIKGIQEILKYEDWADIKITFYGGCKEICFDIYEVEVPIVVNLENNTVKLLTEFIQGNLTLDMLEELTKITRLIDDSLPQLKEDFNS